MSVPTLGFCARAPAMAARCFWPPESVLVDLWAQSSRSTACRASLTSLATAAWESWYLEGTQGVLCCSRKRSQSASMHTGMSGMVRWMEQVNPLLSLCPMIVFLPAHMLLHPHIASRTPRSSMPRWTSATRRAMPPRARAVTGVKPDLPSPNATSAATVGMTIWWSGFWSTMPSGPSMLTSPDCRCSSRPRMRSTVDLPQPLAPARMCSVPLGIDRLAPRSTCP